MNKSEKLIVNGNIYVMNSKELHLVLDKIANYVPERTIYALKHFGITEVINKSYKTEKGLKSAITRFENEGIKVYWK